MNTYTTEQQIHSLSLITNAAFGLKFATEQELQAYVTNVITTTLTEDQETQSENSNIGCNYLGSTAANTAWQLVWGPIVYSNKPDALAVVADNTMALYYNASQNLFVVGIAGTNVVSVYGWETEDFDVSTTVAWNAINTSSNAPANVQIATGTSLGIAALLAMQDPANGNNTMIEQLKSFLASSVKTAQPSLAVAGHSLGGALTPLMALYLNETRQDWNTGANPVGVITAYPTAGPTAGNQNFASYYEGLLGTSFVYTSKYNVVDVVPQAWELDTMVTVPFLYDAGMYTTTPPDAIISAFTLGAIGASVNSTGWLPKFNNYTQITPRITLPGEYVPIADIVSDNPAEDDIYKGLNKLPDIFLLSSVLASSKLNGEGYAYFLQNFGYFLFEAAYQHTTAYNAPNMLNIQAMVTEYEYIKSTIPGPPDARLPQHVLLIKNIFSKIPGLNRVQAFSNIEQETPATAG